MNWVAAELIWNPVFLHTGVRARAVEFYICESDNQGLSPRQCTGGAIMRPLASASSPVFPLILFFFLLSEVPSVTAALSVWGWVTCVCGEYFTWLGDMGGAMAHLTWVGGLLCAAAPATRPLLILA